MKSKLSVWCTTFLVSLLLSGSTAVWAAKDPIYTSFFSNLAVSGYDTVAYFSEGKPVKGLKNHATEYMGAKWHFKSAKNLEFFVAEPSKYAPQYGGYCAWAVAHNAAVKSDPLVWTIHNDKLYLNFDISIRDKWRADVDAQISTADAIWPAPLGN